MTRIHDFTLTLTLDCLPEPIDGTTYLKRDLRVVCYEGEHAFLMIGAGLVLLILGLGLPIAVAVFLTRADRHSLSSDDHFFELYGFLFKGYRMPEDGGIGMQGWEAIGMVRKVAIVAIGALVTEPYYAVLAAIAISMVSLWLQASYSPFSEDVFNRLETLCLGALASTQVLSVLYLRSVDAALETTAELEASGQGGGGLAPNSTGTATDSDLPG